MSAPEEPVANDRNDPIQAAIHAALRERFRAFLNDDARFRKFITACNDLYSKDRELRYWQQPVWDLFIKENPEYASLDAPAIRKAFHVCHVHLIPLKQVEVPIYKGSGTSVTLTKPSGPDLKTPPTPRNSPWTASTGASVPTLQPRVATNALPGGKRIGADSTEHREK